MNVLFFAFNFFCFLVYFVTLFPFLSILLVLFS